MYITGLSRRNLTSYIYELRAPIWRYIHIFFQSGTRIIHVFLFCYVTYLLIYYTIYSQDDTDYLREILVVVIQKKKQMRNKRFSLCPCNRSRWILGFSVFVSSMDYVDFNSFLPTHISFIVSRHFSFLSSARKTSVFFLSGILEDFLTSVIYS